MKQGTSCPNLPRLWIFTAAVLAAMAAACGVLRPALAPPRLSLIDIRLMEARLLEQRCRLTFRVLNPNDVEIPIRGLYVELELEDQPFATGVSDAALTVPAYGEGELAVVVSANVLKTVTRLAGFLQGRPEAVSYRLSGHVNLGPPAAGRLPVSAEGTLRLTPETR